MDNKFSFIKSKLESIKPEKSKKRYYDTQVSGLLLLVLPSGKKKFTVRKKLNGKESNVSLGEFPILTIANARKQAIEELNTINNGVNPNDKRKQSELELITLNQVLVDYFEHKPLASKTVTSYQSLVDNYFDDWKFKPLLSLQEEDIKTIHRAASTGSKSQADGAMRVLRALFNFATFEYRDIDNNAIFKSNPVKVLSHLRSWNKVDRKTSRIKQSDLKNWFKVIDETRKEASLFRNDFTIGVCDYLEVCLLTGLRKQELLNLTWDRVDFKERSFYIDKTKNGDPLELPISNYIHSIFKRRKEQRSASRFVFNADNEFGQIKEPKKIIKGIAERAQIDFTLHDLRRTFTSIAESLNIGTYTLKRLTNHKTKRDDVTAGYTILTPEELREPAQRIEDKLLTLAGIKESDSKLNASLMDTITNMDSDKKRELLFTLLNTTNDDANLG
jgi:integrase